MVLWAIGFLTIGVMVMVYLDMLWRYWNKP